MRIAVYSGSFDPLHIGHLAIMERLSRDPGIDWTYLVVSPQNPFKDKSKADNARDRLEAARKAVLRHPGLRVWVDDIEMGMEPPQYTIRTLDEFRRREPGNVFTLVIGADNLASMRQWRDYRRVLLEYGVAVYPREGHDIAALEADLLNECPDYMIRTLDSPLVNVSSTGIREGIAAGRDMSALLM